MIYGVSKAEYGKKAKYITMEICVLFNVAVAVFRKFPGLPENPAIALVRKGDPLAYLTLQRPMADHRLGPVGIVLIVAGGTAVCSADDLQKVAVIFINAVVLPGVSFVDHHEAITAGVDGADIGVAHVGGRGIHPVLLHSEGEHAVYNGIGAIDPRVGIVQIILAPIDIDLTVRGLADGVAVFAQIPGGRAAAGASSF